MTAINFNCTKDCGAVLRADLGRGKTFGPIATDEEALAHAARRREYIGEQVEIALLAHLLFDCPVGLPDDVCAVCASPIELAEPGDDVCDTCKNVLHQPSQHQAGGQQ